MRFYQLIRGSIRLKGFEGVFKGIVTSAGGLCKSSSTKSDVVLLIREISLF